MSFDKNKVLEIDRKIEDRKKNSPVGPWTTEPNRVEFKHAGFDCLLSRTTLGHWCGYVGLPKDHKFHGADYDDVDVNVHGGLTYAEECNSHICHYTPNDDKLWWLGFDCAHAGDKSPLGSGRALMNSSPMGMMALAFGENDLGEGEHYWTLEEVKAETESLAEQLAKA